MIGALSNRGKYYYMVQEAYFKKEDVVRFIQLMQGKLRRRPFAIFWDNCRTHHAIVVKEYLEDAEIPCIFNVAYSPQYNGIELLWAHQKQKFRKQMT